jgi:hypothetical protein
MSAALVCGHRDDAPPVYPPAACCAFVATGFMPGFVSRTTAIQKSRDKPARYNAFSVATGFTPGFVSRDKPARYNAFSVATGFTPGFVSSDDGYPKIAG